MVPSVFPNPHYSTMARITYHVAEEALAFCPHLDLSRQLPNARAAWVGETHKEGLLLGTERSLSVVVCELCARRRPERDWGRLAGGELVSWMVAVAIIIAAINMAIVPLTLV